MFVVTGARYTEVLFHILYYYWAEEYRSLYRGVRYTGVFVVTGARVISRFFSIHCTIIGLKNIVRYTGVFVIPGCSLYRGVRCNGGPLYRGSFPYIVLLLG